MDKCSRFFIFIYLFTYIEFNFFDSVPVHLNRLLNNDNEILLLQRQNLDKMVNDKSMKLKLFLVFLFANNIIDKSTTNSFLFLLC